MFVKSSKDTLLLIDQDSDTNWDISLDEIDLTGYFSLQIHSTEDLTDPENPVAWTGNVDVSFLVSNDGVNFVAPANNTIFAAHDADPADDLKSFTPPACRFLRIRVVENDTGTFGCVLTLCIV